MGGVAAVHSCPSRLGCRGVGGTTLWGGGVRGVGRRAGWERRGRAPPGIRAPLAPAAPTVLLPELRSLLAAGRARLVDVRSREEAAAGTIPGALNIPGTGLGGGARHVVDPGGLS